VNALTTNLTAFFREPHHFPILRQYADDLARPLSIWCAAASTGEEPYSIAITLAESRTAGGRGEVVATDINTQVLARAREAVYPFERVADVPEERLKRFFLKGRGSRQGMVRVRPEIANMVS